GALKVGAHEQRVAALLLEPAGELARRRRLTGALQAGEQHDRRWLRCVGDAQVLAAEGVDQLLVDDLDDLLRRTQALREVEADGLFLDAGDDTLNDAKVDVGFEQGQADLPQDLVDLWLTERAAAAEVLEDRVEAIGKCVEHRRSQATPGTGLRRRGPRPPAARRHPAPEARTDRRARGRARPPDGRP